MRTSTLTWAAVCTALGAALALAGCTTTPPGDHPYSGVELHLDTDDDGWLTHEGAPLPWVEVGDDGDASTGNVRAEGGFIKLHGAEAMICRPMLVPEDLAFAWVAYAVVANDAFTTPFTVKASFYHFADVDDYLDSVESLASGTRRTIGTGSGTSGDIVRYDDGWTVMDVEPSMAGTTALKGVVAACLRVPQGADADGAELWFAGAKAAVGEPPAPYASVLDDE